MDLLLFVQLALNYLVSVWVEAHGEALAQGLAAAILPQLGLVALGVVVALLMLGQLFDALVPKQRPTASGTVGVSSRPRP